MNLTIHSIVWTASVAAYHFTLLAQNVTRVTAKISFSTIFFVIAAKRFWLLISVPCYSVPSYLLGDSGGVFTYIFRYFFERTFLVKCFFYVASVFKWKMLSFIQFISFHSLISSPDFIRTDILLSISDFSAILNSVSHMIAEVSFSF